MMLSHSPDLNSWMLPATKLQSVLFSMDQPTVTVQPEMTAVPDQVK